MATTKYQKMSYEDIRPISQFSNVIPGNDNVLWGIKNNQYSGSNLNQDGETWKWLCNAIDIYWGKPTLNATGNVTKKITTTTDLLKFIETTAQAVNNLDVDINRYRAAKDAILPIDDGYMYYDSSLSYGKYINLERISLATSDEDGHIKGSRGSDNEPFYIFRNNVGQEDESFDVWDSTGRYHGRWNKYDGYQRPNDYTQDDNIDYINAYLNNERPIDVFGFIKEILCENLVSEDKDGLMSADDKQKLNNIPDNIIVDISEYKTENATLPIDDGYIYYDSSFDEGNGKYINLERISLAHSDEDYYIEGSRGSDNDPFYIFRNKVGQDGESFDVWDCSGEYHGRWNEYGYEGPKSDIYDNPEHPIDVFGYIKEILCENLASEYKDGLMSSSDKEKLDNLPTVFNYSQYCKPNSKIPFDTDFSNYILPCNVEIRTWRDNEYWYLCFATNDLGDIDETSNTDWRLRKNYYLFMLHDVSGSEDRNNYIFVNVYTNTTVLLDQTALDAKVAEAFGYSDNSSNS